MRRFVIAMIVALSAGSACAAPASKESVEELLAVTRVERMMDQLYGGLEQSIRAGMTQAAGNRPLNDDQKKIFERMPAILVAALREEFGWATMQPKYVQIYQETFEQEELDGLLAFYKSPAGRAMLDKMPTVLQKSMDLARLQMLAAMPRLNEKMEALLRDVPRAK